MKSLIYIFGLFFYVMDVFASSETGVTKEEERELKEKILQLSGQKHKNLVVSPIIYLENGKIITPSTKYKDIKKGDEPHFLYNIEYIVSRIERSFMLHDLIVEMNISLMSIPEMAAHYKKHKKNIKNTSIRALNQYKKNQQTFKEFLDNLIDQLINREQIPQNYIKKSIEVLTSLQDRIDVIEKKKEDENELLFEEEDDIYDKKDEIYDLLYLYTLLKDNKYIENIVQIQREFGECIASRCAIDNKFPYTIKQWLVGDKMIDSNFIIFIKISSILQEILNPIKEKYPVAVGELVMYLAIHNKETYNWKEIDIVKKAEDIAKSLEKKEENRKKVEEELISWNKKETQKKQQQEAKPNKKKKPEKTQKKVEKKLSKKNLEEEQTEEQNLEENDETSTQEIEHALKNQDINPKQLFLNSNNAPNAYTFHSRVLRWSFNDLDSLQAKIDEDHNSAYYNQPIDSLLFAKYLHNIFPVVSIFNSEYRDEFFYKNIDPSKVEGYLADGLMTIKEQAKNSKERTIKGQVEIGFTNYKENQIFHLYFKPLSERDSSIVENNKNQDYGQEDSNSTSKDDFTYAGPLIYAAEFIWEGKNENILIVFPKTNTPGYPAVTKTLLLKKRKKNRNGGRCV
ncbi:hypothetical protein NEFER03_2267 [Nematocida sp. LUAm3]|nr:hypothetical protein NEFER03_2267 [Nematocida sp. LUAm3]KAI5174798.1 hypothetical protein NEFER02_0908 [Nematocida sp. LUAm2]KAI5179429.1 hypothetical protein NEFER01_2246 [Nematocida sp. LUAm1]